MEARQDNDKTAHQDRILDWNCVLSPITHYLLPITHPPSTQNIYNINYTL
jgi:hypothetical protein